MVKVYYEQAGYAQLVAYFDDENTYNKCVEALEQDAQENNFKFITESTNDLDLTEIDEIIEPIFNDEKTFYLIGGDATREYNDNGIEGVVNESEANDPQDKDLISFYTKKIELETLKALRKIEVKKMLLQN